MPDINLFRKPGFQSKSNISIPDDHPEQIVPDSKQKQPPNSQKKPKKKAKSTLAWESIVAFLLAVGIGVIIVWYLQYRSDVKSIINEFTIEEYQSLNGNLP
ncbi:MAG: hypothetical protein ACE5EE_00935 [Fidelibacterota bacterium]